MGTTRSKAAGAAVLLGVAAAATATVTSTAASAENQRAATNTVVFPTGQQIAPNVIQARVSATETRAARAYWTPARMAAAQPAAPAIPGPMAAPDTAQSRQLDRGAPQDTRAPRPVTVPPAYGSVDVTEPDLQAQEAVDVERPYTNLPDRLNVAIFYVEAGTGLHKSCTGAIVNSTSKRQIATAGHCVSNGNGVFHGRFMVVPAFGSRADELDDRPFGTWFTRDLFTTHEWHNFGNRRQDIAYLNVLARGDGTRIVEALGGHGSLFNLPREQDWRVFGYPAEGGFSGFSQFMCASGRAGDDAPEAPNPPRPGANTIAISCNMTRGSSGGGWVIQQRPSGVGFVNGVISYSRTGLPGFQFGPYFGEEARQLFLQAARAG
jgi:V8-like Glu-specific endopeptidase